MIQTFFANGKMGGNQWDLLRASHQLALKKLLSSVLVRETVCEFLTFRTYVSRHRGRSLDLGWGYVTSSSSCYGSHSGGSF